MPRLKLDPVDVAFRAWAQLDDKQRDQFEGRVVGYWEAVRRFSIDVATPKAPTTPTRQRKSKFVDITNRPDVVMGPGELAKALSQSKDNSPTTA